MAGPEEEGFKVTDRRRRLDEDEAPAPPPISGAPEAPPAPTPSRTTAPIASPPGEPSRAERDLTGLFIMLASSAAMALGEVPDPLSGEVHRDLGQAVELVDLLVLLREKTEGHRSLEESQVLEEVIYDLQLRYVAATKRTGPSTGRARG
jgi:hypothetical protein